MDPVRFISNFSTGELGYQLAREAVKLGFQVTLLAGPTFLKPPKGVTVIPFQSASDLSGKLIKEFKKTDTLFMTAAICDYEPLKISSTKIKRDQKITIRLKATPDLLKKLIPYKKKQVVVGFCLETGELEKKAKKKLKIKKLDYIVGNFISKTHNPFGEGKTSVLLIDKAGTETWIEDISKKRLARFLLTDICS